MKPPGSSFSTGDASELPEREREIAERVRESLHLSASMSAEEVAQQFRNSVAWRRERLRLTGDELWEKVLRVGQFLLEKLRGWIRSDWH